MCIRDSAYYELIPYNYSFLSAEQKFIVHDSFRQLIAQSREGKIHALQIATESSIRSMQEQSKKLVSGKLKEVAYQKIDEQTEAKNTESWLSVQKSGNKLIFSANENTTSKLSLHLCKRSLT